MSKCEPVFGSFLCHHRRWLLDRNHKMQSVFKFIDRESCVFSCVYGFKIQNKSRLPTRKYKIKWNANQDAGWDQDLHVLHMNKLVNRQLSIVQLQKKYRHIQRAHRTKGTIRPYNILRPYNGFQNKPIKLAHLYIYREF